MYSFHNDPSAVSFDSTHGAGICDERPQITELGKDRRYSTRKSRLFDVHTVVCCQHQDRRSKYVCSQLFSNPNPLMSGNKKSRTTRLGDSDFALSKASTPLFTTLESRIIDLLSA